MRNTEKAWLEDFNDFMATDEVSVPENISQTILYQVRKDLHPSSWLVFAKLLGIHSVVGTLSLGICNQFGMSPFHTGFSLSQYFMKFGHSACMTFCGFLFVGLSVALGRLFLRGEEFRVLKKNAFIQAFSLSLISLAAFQAFGAEMALEIGVLWLVGGVVGGILASFTFGQSIFLLAK